MKGHRRTPEEVTLDRLHDFLRTHYNHLSQGQIYDIHGAINAINEVRRMKTTEAMADG